jgi:hypothetical protein
MGERAIRRRGLMRILPQQDHADLGLVENDNTEDMRRAPAATEALRNEPPTSSHHNHEWEF